MDGGCENNGGGKYYAGAEDVGLRALSVSWVKKCQNREYLTLHTDAGQLAVALAVLFRALVVLFRLSIRLPVGPGSENGGILLDEPVPVGLAVVELPE